MTLVKCQILLFKCVVWVFQERQRSQLLSDEQLYEKMQVKVIWTMGTSELVGEQATTLAGIITDVQNKTNTVGSWVIFMLTVFCYALAWDSFIWQHDWITGSLAVVIGLNLHWVNDGKWIG